MRTGEEGGTKSSTTSRLKAAESAEEIEENDATRCKAANEEPEDTRSEEVRAPLRDRIERVRNGPVNGEILRIDEHSRGRPTSEVREIAREQTCS
ncbi:hypothetical protein PMAYCL1PPCAC_08228 [Pristionchus mayeri]|uniref:Uncharacterized protein n=1 Tax=Pristionchus mayeri TaxID=1317129 RepID=A0AAN4ZBB1_9BILA|nr:hypothetical protein PMAYCL1PPCAC_08228 [Pristionchus mayeri]